MHYKKRSSPQPFCSRNSTSDWLIPTTSFRFGKHLQSSRRVYLCMLSCVTASIASPCKEISSTPDQILSETRLVQFQTRFQTATNHGLCRFSMGQIQKPPKDLLSVLRSQLLPEGLNAQSNLSIMRLTMFRLNIQWYFSLQATKSTQVWLGFVTLTSF